MPESGQAACYVGLDAGGSRSRAMLTSTNLEPLSTCDGPDANPSRLSVEVAAKRLALLVETVRQVGESRRSRPVELLACGVAGAGQISTRKELEYALSRLLPDVSRVHVTSDIEALLEAMLPAPDPVGQVALIAGTGSVAAGRNARGDRTRAGGEGWPAGDRGSGAWIGHQALLRAQQGREDPSRRTALSASLPEVLPGTTAHPARDLAALLPTVIEAAQASDAVALALLRQAGQELARTALEVIRTLGLDQLSFPLAVWGGVFRAGPLIGAPLSDTIRAGAPGVRIVQPTDPPELGALRCALRERNESP